MCSDRSRLAGGLAAALALVLLVACGKQGDPRPRPRNIPQPAGDLSLRLRGDRVLLAFAYPAATVAGLPLDGLEAAIVYEIVQPHAENLPLPRLSAADFDAVGKPVRELTGRELSDAIVGGRILAELTLPAGAVGAGEVRAYAVRTRALRGEASPWSNVVVLRAIATPPSPEDLELEPTKAGIALRWTPVADGLGSVVLRRAAVDPRWSEPLAILPAQAGEHLDRSALYGTRYVYTVLTLGAEVPPVESAPRLEREIDYRDVFAPDPPAGLRGLVAGGQVRLIWDASPDADLAGYLVERSADGGEFARLTRAPLAGLEHTDAAPPVGARRLVYRVVAVDRAGNEAPPSAPVELAAP
jgi:hypothetical protein